MGVASSLNAFGLLLESLPHSCDSQEVNLQSITPVYQSCSARLSVSFDQSQTSLDLILASFTRVYTMAAASVLIPLSAINQNGGVLPPSALVQHTPRHGRSRANSSKGKGGRGRAYSVIEERDVTISKAVAFVLKRSVHESEANEDDKEGRLLCDSAGWVSVADVVRATHSSNTVIRKRRSCMQYKPVANMPDNYYIAQTPQDSRPGWDPSEPSADRFHLYQAALRTPGVARYLC